MQRISIRRLGFAAGATAALLYLGCVLVMLVAPKAAVVRFFNSVLHGWDVEPIMRWDMPWWEAALGTVEMALLGWLVGALLAAFYNLGRGAAGRPGTAPRQEG
ncbi:MAG: DUF5676 family membrane protein [Dehalococcoidia bacterium]